MGIPKSPVAPDLALSVNLDDNGNWQWKDFKKYTLQVGAGVGFGGGITYGRSNTIMATPSQWWQGIKAVAPYMRAAGVWP